MQYGSEQLRRLLAAQFFAYSSFVARARKKRQLARRAKRHSPRQQRRPRKPRTQQRNSDPNFWQTQWGRMYQSLSQMNGGTGPTIDSRPGKLFRRRFRVPWVLFSKLLELCRTHALFGPHADDATDCTGIPYCPIELKLMGVLRMLGRAWICDDVAEATGMGESTVRLAFRTFTENFVAALYDVYIYRPMGDKLARLMGVFGRMGLPGCVGSTDCVHLKWERCPVSLTNLCKGKEGYPTLVYSAVVDHHRRIL